MTLEYQMTSRGETFDWQDLPSDYNEIRALEAGDLIVVRDKAPETVVLFAPGYYRMRPSADNPHPDLKWFDKPPWATFDIDPEEMEVLAESTGDFYPVGTRPLEEIREGRARNRNDHHVNYGLVRCAYDRCWHFLERKSTLDNNALLWNVALASGWKLAWPGTDATDLYCPAKHNSMGVPLTDLSGIPYDA